MDFFVVFGRPGFNVAVIQERQGDLQCYQIENHSLALLAKLFALSNRQCHNLASLEEDCWTLGGKTALCCVADTV